MKVKGVAFLGRKAAFEKQFGESKWQEAMAAFKASGEELPDPVLPSTRLDIDPFLRLNDLLIERYYGGDEAAYWRLGEASAHWAFTEGPYKHFIASRDYPTYVQMAAALYRNYFNDGDARGTMEGDVVTLRITDVPISRPHPYLEYTICGFFRHGLEMIGAEVASTHVVRGYSKGDTEVHYEFVLAPSA